MMFNSSFHFRIALLCLSCLIVGCGGCRLSGSPDEPGAVLNVDTIASADEWNKVWQSHILQPGRYYQVAIPYQMIECGEDAYLYSVVIPNDNPAKTLASVRWRTNNLKTQSFSFYLPENETNSRVVLGMHKKGRASVGDVTIRELPPIDPDAVSYVSLPDYAPYGMCTHFTRWSAWGPERGYTDEQVRRSIKKLAGVGIQWIRVEAHWVAIEDKEGIYDDNVLRRIDNIIQWANESGIEVYLQLGGQPKWASTHPDKPDYWDYGTDRFAEFKNYVRYVTQRYRGKVRYWEVGNEVDWVFWKDSMADYARYLKTAAGIIRKADSENRIILGSFAFDGTHVWNPEEGAEENALRRLYELGIKPDFDVVGVHYYPLESSDNLHEAVSAVNQICSVMAEFGDDAKPVWLTESGYSSPPDRQGGLKRQADYLRLLYSQIIAHPRIEKIFWYNDRCKFGESELECNFGVLNNDFSERPAFGVLRDLKKHRLKPVNRTMLPSGGK